MKIFILSVVLVSFFTGCGKNIPTPKQRIDTAKSLVSNKLDSKIYKTKDFNLFSYQSDLKMCQNKKVRIYIEGDGLAWVTSTKISTNPTPIDPIALKLALKDTSSCKLYLARPCQYINNQNCNDEYWTSHRFSKKVLDSYIDTLNTVKKEYQVKEFELYGFSGGGAIATLLASQRDDISFLVTIAGNIDHKTWTDYHRITPLDGSLNPIDYAYKLKNIKQYHLLGENDKIINYNTYKKYHQVFKNNPIIKHISYSNYTHTCCWDNNWDKIIKSLK